jgi:hypothetical protein
MRDLHNNIKAEVAFNTAGIVTNTTTVGRIIDMQGFGSAEFLIQAGNLIDGTYTPLIEEGDASNLSDAVAVADKDLLGTEAAAVFIATNDHIVNKIGYIGSRRYVRLSILSTGITTGGTVSALIVKSNASDLPVV